MSTFDPEVETFDSAGSSDRGYKWAMKEAHKAGMVLDVQLMKLMRHVRSDGEITVLEQLPFISERLFVITASKGAARGNHAHRKCSQLLMCVHGAVDVIVDGGVFNRGTYRLEAGEPDCALWVPPLTWITLIFPLDAVVNVLCDRPYEEEDYIRDYTEYLSELRDVTHSRHSIAAKSI